MYTTVINRIEEPIKEYYSVHTDSKCTCNKIFLSKDIPPCAKRGFGNKPILFNSIEELEKDWNANKDSLIINKDLYDLKSIKVIKISSRGIMPLNI